LPLLPLFQTHRANDIRTPSVIDIGVAIAFSNAQSESSPAKRSIRIARIYLNLASRMKVFGPNQLWIADITYIRYPLAIYNHPAQPQFRGGTSVPVSPPVLRHYVLDNGSEVDLFLGRPCCSQVTIKSSPAHLR
jgi:hypothetical protein